MIIELSKVSPGGERIEAEEPAEIIELEKDAGIRLTKPLQIDVLVEVLPGEALVRGTIETEATYVCSRCTREFSVPLRVEDFVRAKPYSDISEQVDLTEDVREDIILHFPTCPVCSPDCKGLCFQCGADLNKGPCSCKPPAESSAWSALDGL